MKDDLTAVYQTKCPRPSKTLMGAVSVPGGVNINDLLSGSASGFGSGRNDQYSTPFSVRLEQKLADIQSRIVQNCNTTQRMKSFQGEISL